MKDTIELEAFVHGSMCYSYSGACLLSSFIGGESGNRGRCKGPCRLPYKTIVANKNVGAKHRELAPYILSMKDMCALRNLKALIDAGVTSFKIEGRMRKPDYVEGVTRIYKKYIDNIIAEKNGNIVAKHGESDIEKDEQYLFKLYNKGGFTNYYEKHNGIDMIQRYERK